MIILLIIGIAVIVISKNLLIVIKIIFNSNSHMSCYFSSTNLNQFINVPCAHILTLYISVFSYFYRIRNTNILKQIK